VIGQDSQALRAELTALRTRAAVLADRSMCRDCGEVEQAAILVEQRELWKREKSIKDTLASFIQQHDGQRQ